MPTCKILASPGQSVKRRIRRMGVKLGDVAVLAGIAQSTLTLYIQGKRRNPITQFAIAFALSELTGRRVIPRRFWGELWGELPAERRREAAAARQEVA